MAKKTIHQRIMIAAKAGRGLRLTLDEVVELSRDNAIVMCAMNDDETDAELKFMKSGVDHYG